MQLVTRSVDGTSVAAECRRLEALAEGMPALAERQGVAFAAWRRDLARVAASAASESLAAEAVLDDLTLQLRRLWMSTAHAFADEGYRSPLAGTSTRLPNSAPIAYEYERSMDGNALEGKLAAYRPVPPGWRAEHFLFSSGMAAIAGAVNALPALFDCRPGERVRAAVTAGYFETHALLALHASAIDARAAGDEAALRALLAAEPFDVAYVEPVIYDLALPAVDLLALARDVAALPSPPALIVDTTLIGPTFPAARLLDTLRDVAIPFVLQVSSGLKLDQAGLELANVGIATLFVRDDAPIPLEALAARLHDVRRLGGTGLAIDALALLDVPFFLDPACFLDYTNAVFAHNLRLARSIRPGRTVRRAVHPALAAGGDLPWARTPFVMLELTENDRAFYEAFEARVEAAARERGIPLARGGSFGFRGHRFEAIALEGAQQAAIFKIALGARSGPAVDAIVNLFGDLRD